MKSSQTTRGKGKSRKAIRETIQKDLKIKEWNRNMENRSGILFKLMVIWIRQLQLQWSSPCV